MGSRIVRRWRAGRPTLVGGGFFMQGCALHLHLQRPKPKPKQQQKLAYLGMAGWVRWRETP
ncbi:hypothetical protein D7U83_10270 [Stenotrophomonas maltophilia]|nr:hypothetical protein [Stenotrophomonas maltophilia]